MNTFGNIQAPRDTTAASVILAVLAMAGLPLAGHSGDARNEAPIVLEKVVVGETKTHTLFMGADISVNLDKDLYPVRNVVGSNWVVSINGDDREISARSAPINLKITPNLKLTEVAAVITGFQKAPAYSYDNDPSVRITRAMASAASLNSEFLMKAADAEHVADMEVVNQAGLNPYGGAATFAASNNQFGAAAMLQTARTAGAILHPPSAANGQSGPPPNPLVSTNSAFASNPALASALDAFQAAEGDAANGLEPTGRVATMGHDAMEIEFSVSSAKPLHDPYVVTITKYRKPDGKPGEVYSLVYARALDPIYAQQSHVHFTEEGFPFNYELVDFQLHLYNRGQEVATNLSDRRVEMTRDEAFEYVKIEYVSSHRGETLPAVPAMGRLPAELPSRVASGKYADTFFAKVSKEGLAEGVFADAKCSSKIEDPFLEDVVKSIRFKPALAEGKPVDGIAALNLNKLQI
jgi:hypothetical protein